MKKKEINNLNADSTLPVLTKIETSPETNQAANQELGNANIYQAQGSPIGTKTIGTGSNRRSVINNVG